MKKFYWLLAFTFLSTGAFASGYLVTLGNGVTVDKVHAHPGGGLTLWVSSTEIQNPDSCDRLDKIHIRSSDQGYQTMVSVVMAAYISKQKLGFWSPGCAIIPFWGGTKTFPIANNLWITE